VSDTDERWDAVDEGIELLREGSAAEAIAELLRVIERDPDNEYAYHYLGAAYFEEDELERSLKAYLTALEKSPGYLGAIVGAGHTLRMMGELDKAIRMGKQALQLQKEDQDALYLLGLAHYQRGDKAAAVDYFDRFLLTSPEAEVRLEVLGLLQVLRGEVVPLSEEPQD
jgi:tetratricopeptide (TPR) repeat protein